MAKLNISQILAMESASVTESEPSKKLKRLQKKRHSISREGIFDFFRKKKGEDSKKKPTDPKEHFAELENAEKVSVHLQTTSVDNEIKYLEELISKGLPFFKKDYDRLTSSFKFVADNHKDILSKIDKLVEISFPGADYKLAPGGHSVQFSTFYVIIDNMASDKEHQAIIGNGWDYYDHDDEFPDDLSDELISQYEKLYCIDEAIPCLDFILPRQMAAKDQHRVYLDKNDPKLQKLLNLNMELIEKGEKTVSEEDHNRLIKLAANADKLTHPKSLGDGDEYGLQHIVYQRLGYQYELGDGFKQDFIKNYTAH